MNSGEIFENKVEIKPEWIDHNGHLNVAYFVLAFDYATDAVYEQLGLGDNYPEEHGCSVFTLGMDVDYKAELFSGDVVRITTQLIDCDHKRVHYYHRMYNEETGELAAVNECLAMNISLAEKCSTDFPEKIQKKLAAVKKVHETLSLPEGGGRLSIRRK